MKKIAILGATGSIGKQTVEVVLAHPDKFSVTAVTANRSVDELARIAVAVGAEKAVIADESLYGNLKERLSGTSVMAAAGMDAIVNTAIADDDIIMAAMVGAAGLLPLMAALRVGKTVALANKEPLVAAGEIIMRTAKECGAAIIPVDSEPSAIFQCMMGQENKSLSKIWLTASGGALKHLSSFELERVTPEMALQHPTWQMGRKITIDSATLMNKGLEMIEAHWLFGVPAKDIEIIIHPQSILHSLVEFCDGTMLAQMGIPTMLTPIQFALGYPERLTKNWAPLNLAELGMVTFQQLDTSRFPAPDLARKAIEKGGSCPACLNAANEIAVEAFLNNRIGFMDIIRVTEEMLKNQISFNGMTLEDIVETDRETRIKTEELINRMR
jgi:1-deoxy-D-xylulose-5-phosphate reductoisomerase